MWTVDHTCERREGVDESGEQPEEQPSRLATTTGLKRPRALPKRQRGRNGEEKNEEKNRTTIFVCASSLVSSSPFTVSVNDRGFKEITHLQIAEQIVQIPEIQMVHGTQASDNFGHTGGNCGGSSRSESLFPQNPHFPCSSRHPCWRLGSMGNSLPFAEYVEPTPELSLASPDVKYVTPAPTVARLQ